MTPHSPSQPNLQFTIELSNPKQCTIGTGTATGTIVTEDGAYLPTDNTGYSTPLTYPEYTLAWSDEFAGSALDLNAWNQETGNGSGGWGNNELEYYTNSTKNTFVSNDNLIIEARKELTSGLNYTSGRMTTQGKNTFKFGRINIRAKLPVGKESGRPSGCSAPVFTHSIVAGMRRNRILWNWWVLIHRGLQEQCTGKQLTAVPQTKAPTTTWLQAIFRSSFMSTALSGQKIT